MDYIELRKIRCFDGLHYSFELLRNFYSGIYENCKRIIEDNSRIIAALASCWGFIDALYRIREIALSTPSINSKHLEMRVFIESTELAEKYRHYIQHLRGELSNKPPNPYPVWGSLSWVDESDSDKAYTALLGAQIPGTTYTGCVFDIQNKKWVSKVCLGVGQHSFNFDPIYDSSLRFKKYIIPKIIENASNEVKLHEKLPIITMKLQHPNA
jgi:hypothetical protein